MKNTHKLSSAKLFNLRRKLWRQPFSSANLGWGGGGGRAPQPGYVCTWNLLPLPSFACVFSRNMGSRDHRAKCVGFERRRRELNCVLKDRCAPLYMVDEKANPLTMGSCLVIGIYVIRYLKAEKNTQRSSLAGMIFLGSLQQLL